MHYLKLFCTLPLLRHSSTRGDHIKLLPTISPFSLYWGGLIPAHWSCSLQTTLLQTAQRLCLYPGNMASCFPASAEQCRQKEQTAYGSCPSQGSFFAARFQNHTPACALFLAWCICLFCTAVGLVQEDDRARPCTQPGHLTHRRKARD